MSQAQSIPKHGEGYGDNELMDVTSIIVALITGAATVLAVVITNTKGNEKMTAEMKTSQAVTDTKLVELTREVREHNNFAQRVPVIEQRLDTVEKRIDKLEALTHD